MMNTSMGRKAGVVLASAFGLALFSARPLVLTASAEDVPQGFKKGEFAPEPPADMIEAGKRVYFTKCVWCHGVDVKDDIPVMLVDDEPSAVKS